MVIRLLFPLHLCEIQLTFWIQRNTNVTVLDLAWNGLGYEGSLGVGEMLRGNHYLRELDVTSNRINWEGATLVARGLAENDGLEILKASL